MVVIGVECRCVPCVGQDGYFVFSMMVFNSGGNRGRGVSNVLAYRPDELVERILVDVRARTV